MENTEERFPGEKSSFVKNKRKKKQKKKTLNSLHNGSYRIEKSQKREHKDGQ